MDFSTGIRETKHFLIFWGHLPLSDDDVVNLEVVVFVVVDDTIKTDEEFDFIDDRVVDASADGEELLGS